MIRSTTFYGVNADPEMLRLQAEVMAKMGADHEQILTDLPHGEALDAFLRLHRREYYLFFDLDCIVLNREALEEAHGVINLPGDYCVWGAAQNANHLANNQDYCGSFCFGFKREAYLLAGRPTMQHTHRGDVASELTYTLHEKGNGSSMLWPVHVEIPRWRLSDGTMFGLGTTYAGGIYHAFESRHHHESTGMFLKKCREVLGQH